MMRNYNAAEQGGISRGSVRRNITQRRVITMKSLVCAVLVLALALVTSGAFSGLGQSATTGVKELPYKTATIKYGCFIGSIGKLSAQGWYNLPGTTVYASWQINLKPKQKLAPSTTVSLSYSCSSSGSYSSLASKKVTETSGGVSLQTNSNVGNICPNKKPAKRVRVVLSGSVSNCGTLPECFCNYFSGEIVWTLQ